MSRKRGPSASALAAENAELCAQLAEAQETLEAIRTGAVDAIVVGERVFSVESAETLYRFLVEQINEGALLLRLDGTILYSNARFAQLADTPLEEISGSFCRRFLPASDHPRLDALLQAAQHAGVREEFSLQTPAGARRPVSLSLSRLKETDTLSAVITDLTERKLAEGALRQANEELEVRVQQRTASLRAEVAQREQAEQALQRRNIHLQLLHQTAARLLLGRQPVDLLQHFHKQIAQILGIDVFMLYQPDPATGRLRLTVCLGVMPEEQRTLEALRYGRAICPKPGEALQPIMATHIQTDQAPNRRFVRKLGFRSYFYYPLVLNNRIQGSLAFASRQRDDYDRMDQEFFLAIAGTLTEALERQRLESELQRHASHLEQLVNERTAKLRETIADLEGFSYSLVHDMRAPLRAMQAFAAALEEDCGSRLDPQGLDYLRKIKTAASRMDHLITDSLNYSRLLHEELPLAPVNLDHLVRGLAETYPNLQPPRAEIRVEMDDLSVLGNEAALTQVFSNLLGNAVKFVAPGVTPRVRVWAESRTPGRALIWVEDNGIGVPKDAQEKVFGLFQRMHRTEEYPGTGIGLAIVKKSLERIGGQVSLESEPGKGSRFCVELPLAHNGGSASEPKQTE
jgi:PAS domain S-box-containing protein